MSLWIDVDLVVDVRFDLYQLLSNMSVLKDVGT